MASPVKRGGVVACDQSITALHTFDWTFKKPHVYLQMAKSLDMVLLY